MQAEQVDRLTARQKECLRLLLTGRSAKEVGLKLGLSGFTVENHLKAARKMLGVTDSGEAARMLDAHERGIDQGLASQPSSLSEPSIVEASIAPQPDLGLSRRTEPLGQPETSMHFEPLWPGPRRLGGWLIRRRGQRHNDLDLERRLLATASLTWLLLVTAAVTVIGVVMLFHWLTGVAKTGG